MQCLTRLGRPAHHPILTRDPREMDLSAMAGRPGQDSCPVVRTDCATPPGNAPFTADGARAPHANAPHGSLPLPWADVLAGTDSRPTPGS